MPSGDVTVVMPVKNGMPYIVEAIESVLAQGAPIGQILVIDDGSTDGTQAAVEAFSDPRVTLSSNPGRGVSSARNRGITLARGEWVLFLDADDRLIAGGLDKLVRSARPEAVAIYGDYDRIDANGRRLGMRHLIRKRRRKSSGNVIEAIVTMNFIAVGCVLIRRDALLRLDGFDQTLHLCEDWLLWCRLATLGAIDYAPGLHIADYRIHGASTMHRRARAFADFAPVIDRIFTDPLVRRALDPACVPERRAQAELSLRSYVVIEAVRLNAWRLAATEFLASAWRSPASVPTLTLRVAASMAGI